MKKIFSVIGFITALSSYAQTTANPQPFAKTITAADLKKHLYVIASREMEGRETATEGQRKAAAYIENQFRQLGLKPGNDSSFQYPYHVYQDSLTNATLEINGQAFQLDKDFTVNVMANSPATLRFSEVVFLNQNAIDTLSAAMSLGGKLVVVNGVLPTTASRINPDAAARFDALRKKGVAAVLMLSNNFPLSRPTARKSNQNLHAFQAAIAPQQYIVSPAIIGAIANNETANLFTNGITTAQADVLVSTEKHTTTLQSSNVIGILEGTDLKDEYLYITAHYDHLGKRDSVVYYGADDDGSGTVAVLELAEAFSKAKAAGKGPRRSVVFMTVSGEEKGLWGSEFYSSRPLLPMDKTTADLNIDMIGRSDVTRPGDTLNYVYVVGDDKISSELKPISEKVNKQYTRLELDYKYNDPNDRNFIYYRSDHYNFAKKGVPIIFYYDGMLGADYHKPTDTPDKINYNLAMKRAQLVFYTAWEIANRDHLLKRDLPLPVLR